VIVQNCYFDSEFELELQGRRFDDEIFSENHWELMQIERTLSSKLELSWLSFCEICVEFIWLMMNFVRISGELRLNCDGFVEFGWRLIRLGFKVHVFLMNFLEIFACLILVILERDCGYVYELACIEWVCDDLAPFIDWHLDRLDQWNSDTWTRLVTDWTNAKTPLGHGLCNKLLGLFCNLTKIWGPDCN